MRNEIRHALFFAFSALSLGGLALHGSASVAGEASPAAMPATATATSAVSVAAAALPLAVPPAATASTAADAPSQTAARSTDIEKRCDRIERIGKVRFTRCD